MIRWAIRESTKYITGSWSALSGLEWRRYAWSGEQHVCHANRSRIQGNWDLPCSRLSHLNSKRWCRSTTRKYAWQIVAKIRSLLWENTSQFMREAVPCITASTEETCDHLIKIWIARHGCQMTFQSDNGTAFVGELTKELMRRSQVAQAHSTTYHSQTNGLMERQNRTLVAMLRVYCSGYMTDWDRWWELTQVMGAYNSTQHSTTGVSPHMMLTGQEQSTWSEGHQ